MPLLQTSQKLALTKDRRVRLHHALGIAVESVLGKWEDLSESIIMKLLYL